MKKNRDDEKARNSRLPERNERVKANRINKDINE